MKMFTNPELNIHKFVVEDVITTSNPGGGGGGDHETGEDEF